MNFQDIPANIMNFRVKQTGSAHKDLQEQPVFNVDNCQNRPDEFEIRLIDFNVFVKPIFAADILRLNSELASGRAILAQLANPAKDGSIELQIAFFTGDCLEMTEVEIEIGVDEYVESAIAKIDRRKDGFKSENLYGRLEQLCCFPQGDTWFFFLTAGPAIDDVLKLIPSPNEKVNEAPEGRDDAEEQEWTAVDAKLNTVGGTATQKPKAEPTQKNSFCVNGVGLRFVATETALPDGKWIYTVTRLTRRKSESDRALRLAKGKLKFSNWTQAGRIQILAQNQITALTKDDGSYLKKWDEFGNLEGELLLKKARDLGALSYCDLKQNRDGTVSVRILEASALGWKALEDNAIKEVEFVKDLPDYLQNPYLKFAQFVSSITQAEEVQGLPEKHKKNSIKESRYYNVSDYDRESKMIKIKTEDLPPSGILISSLAGDIAQIKRRMAARRAIIEGRSANPQLGLLIEERGQVTQTRRPQKIPPLTAFVRNKVFREKNPPTVMQEKAIEVALNTPDIALIQGPPGTGKTTVIAAILERLNELADKRGGSIKGKILLTGFQHDAVENMIYRLSLNGIPVPKYGKRTGAGDDFSAFQRNLEEWCGKLAGELRARNPQIAKIERETEIKNLCLQYINVPTRALAANLARQIESLGIAILGADCARRAANLVKRFSCEEQLENEANKIIEAVRRLRTRAESFADDGPERAADALNELKNVLDERDHTLVDKASLWRNDDGLPPFLDELGVLKKNLLIRFAAPPVFRVEKQSDEVIAVAEEAIKRIRIAGYSAKDAKSAALAEFLAELENNQKGMIDAVSDYSFAFAATCQQSVNEQMQSLKGITGRKVEDNQKKMEYDFVIVDEAARVSPRDLMIPMTQGKRIILVGDHRQLPHIIDESVIEELSEQEAETFLAKEGEFERDSQSWSSISLFEYMFVKRLPALEEQDGIPRRVTLDKQYRMHPMLGDFISCNFYERFDPTEKFQSGRPASDFVHNLPDTEGKCAVWLEVNAVKGKEQKSGTSWIRPVEATSIASQLQTWKNSEAGKNLSFGVISFYKAQAELIKKHLGTITDDDKKIRIGTVDSFQGMEFDVVFLSMVRTLPVENYIKKRKALIEKEGKPWTDEMEARISFGHLCLYNRLNVSMSRQKKLLVVAGDSGLLQSDLAKEFIPGLVNFFILCQKDGRILQCH